MPDAPAPQRSRGMSDLLPDEMDRLRGVEDAFASVCRAWGYREIRTPVIEPLHLFTAAGTLSPQTLDRVYSFLDWDGWSGERVVLRPDSTIPAARLYAEHLDGGRVAKLFYNQNIFRFTDDGSSREEWQCGVELMGDTGTAGDIELVMLALEALKPLSLPPVRVCLSHAGIVRGVLSAAGMTPEEQSAAYDRLLDGDLGVVDEVEARVPQLNAPLRLLFEVEGEGSGYVENLRGPLTTTIPALGPALDELAAVVAALETAGVAPVIQTVLARNFEYYSGLIVRIEAAGKRLVAGGRYDDLIGLVGTRHVPASGFALYLTPLLDLMAPPARPSGERRIIVQAEGAGPALTSVLYEAAARLRAAGMRTESIEGMHSAPTHRLICREGSPAFTLVWPDGTQQFERLDDVVRVLEPER
ncbi:MAG: ATP phosphoribosyltransferase regulatory subunit [Chloroflexota bacterium]|nr:ATP phosphoribosyltransferase regulatory subunit [Chloroflexota bacterium]